MCSVYLEKTRGMLPLGQLEIFSLEMSLSLKSMAAMKNGILLRKWVELVFRFKIESGLC